MLLDGVYWKLGWEWDWRVGLGDKLKEGTGECVLENDTTSNHKGVLIT